MLIAGWDTIPKGFISVPGLFESPEGSRCGFSGCIGIGGMSPGGAWANGDPSPMSWFDIIAPGRFGGGTPIGTFGISPGGRLMWGPIGPSSLVLRENGETRGIAIGGGGSRPVACSGGG